jgi:hypothetical protein
MHTGASRPSPVTGARRCARGFSFVESAIVLSILGSLGLGLTAVDFDRGSLATAQVELRAALDQAFVLAHHRGTSVTIRTRAEAGTPAAPDVLPLQLPRRVKWGKLAGVPLPKGMDDPEVADRTGEAHSRITISPRHTATASAWFLNDGKDTVCLRLSGRGRVTLLRWKRTTRAWEKA